MKTNFELSSLIATSRYGADMLPAAELTEVKSKGTVQCTQHMIGANYIIFDVNLVIHSVAIDALRMMRHVGDKVIDPDEFVKRIQWFGVDSQTVLNDSKKVLSGSKEVLGDSKEVLGGSKEVLGGSKEVLDGSGRKCTIL
jgi:hypothetical protein